jgi:hypothetical protein
MQVAGIDERNLRREDPGTNFVVFIYVGEGEPGMSWSVDSYLLTDVDFTEVLGWLRENVPNDACYSVGVVVEPPRPTADSDVEVMWVLGADFLNTDPRHLTPVEARITEGMLARRHRVTLP